MSISYCRMSFADVPGALDLMEEEARHNRVWGRLKFDRLLAENWLKWRCTLPDRFSMVAYDDAAGEVVGVLLATLAFQPWSEKRFVTDELFVARKAGPGLLRRLREWAGEVDAEMVVVGTSSGGRRATRVERFFELSGGAPVGGTFMMEVL